MIIGRLNDDKALSYERSAFLWKRGGARSPVYTADYRPQQRSDTCVFNDYYTCNLPLKMRKNYMLVFIIHIRIYIYIFDQIHRQSIDHSTLEMTNILFILKLFVSSSSFERISPISRCLNLPLRVKLFGWTTRFSIFNEIAIHDKDRHGEKPICRVSIRASVLQRKIYGRGLKPFAIFFFFFPLPSLSYTAAFHGERWKRAWTTKEDGEMTRYHGGVYRSSYFHRSKVE